MTIVTIVSKVTMATKVTTVYFKKIIIGLISLINFHHVFLLVFFY